MSEGDISKENIIRGQKTPELKTPNQRIAHFPVNRNAEKQLYEKITFTRDELQAILNLYGRMVASGEWKDYAMDFMRDRAVFSVFRRASEVPLYRIEKNPKLGNKQGAFSVVAATGLILRRGNDLPRVLTVLERKIQLVTS